MPITALSHKGKTWPIEGFVAACLSGECDFPAPVAATIIKNMRDYDNRGTISGSQLHSECDYRKLLEQLDYTEEIGNLFYATYRGSNVHAMIESCKVDPAFKDWVFEHRFFCTMTQEGVIAALKVPMDPDGNEDWPHFQVICDELRSQGLMILSGALDTYDGRAEWIHDWKTAKIVGSWTNVKESWQQQMNCYTVLARRNGFPVKGVTITVMDATEPVVLEVPLVNEDAWIPMYLLPRAKRLSEIQAFSKQEIQDVNDGKVDPPPGFPLPVVNYLCDGENKTQKLYCPFRESKEAPCPIWRGYVAPPPKARKAKN